MSPNDSPERRASRARPPHLVLVGLPGAGKSTVGALVAAALGRRFIDLDREIERRAAMSVSEIFALEGEAGFRAREASLTREIAARQDASLVIAAGGGWVEDPANREVFGRRLLTVYLRAEATTLRQRLAGSAGSRPLLEGPETDARLEELSRRREPIYLQSNHVVTVDSMTPAAVAASIVALASAHDAD